MKPKTKAALVMLLIFSMLAVVGVLTYQNRIQETDEGLVRPVTVEKYPVKTEVTQPSTLEETLVVTGVLEAEQDVTIASEVGGTIKTVYKFLGDPCKKGELLLKLDKEAFNIALTQTQAAQTQAEVNLANSEREWRRMKQLAEKQVATPQQLENAEGAVSVGKAAVRQAAAAVTAAKRNLRETNITCPFTGFVAERMVENGESVAPQAPLVRLVDTSKLKLIVSVASDKLSRLEVGQSAALSDPALPEHRYQGTVARLGIAADPATRTFPVEIEVTDEESRLRTGQIVQAELDLGVYKGVIALPAGAIRMTGDQASAVVIKAGKAKIVDVAIGRNIDGRVIVEQGLKAGDEVVIVGGTDLRDGDQVEVTGRIEPADATIAPHTAEAEQDGDNTAEAEAQTEKTQTASDVPKP